MCAQCFLHFRKFYSLFDIINSWTSLVLYKIIVFNIIISHFLVYLSEHLLERIFSQSGLVQ